MKRGDVVTVAAAGTMENRDRRLLSRLTRFLKHMPLS
jgi:hypothetical protein